MVDGEHYPPVVEAALDDLVARGGQILAALVVGGREKLPASGEAAFGDFPVRTGDDPEGLLETAVRELTPDAVLDLSDEPVLDYRKRHRLAAIALALGVSYRGADFVFEPPPRPRLSRKPSLAMIGTGKRTGKTAVSGFTARTLTAHGIHPVIVAMGRGGPAEPEILRGDQIELSPSDLLALADAGKHAASDYIEDALLTRVPTVGCRRCGGGLAGGVSYSNVDKGVELANGIEGDLIMLEGSGAAIPPCHADVTGLVVSASIPPEYLSGYMGPYRLLLADFVVVTMCESPFGTPSQISEIVARIRESWKSVGGERGIRGGIQVIRTVFRPEPTKSVDGARVFVATTAPEAAADAMRQHLEDTHGCRVAGISHSLSDRRVLTEELEEIADKADVLLCEIKAAGVDVATRAALRAGLEVVYMDNVPVGVDGDDPAALVEEAGELALARFSR